MSSAPPVIDTAHFFTFDRCCDVLSPTAVAMSVVMRLVSLFSLLTLTLSSQEPETIDSNETISMDLLDPINSPDTNKTETAILSLSVNQIDLLSPFHLMNKIDRFCQLANDDIVARLIKNKDKPSCVAYFVLYFEAAIRQSVMTEPYVLDGFSQLKFFMDNGIKRGMSRSIYDPTYPVMHHPSQVFSWRTSLALLLPHVCGVPESWLIDSLSSVFADTITGAWLDLYIFIGLDSNCSYPEIIFELFKSKIDVRPEMTLIVTEFENQTLITDKFDFLSLAAYKWGCQFFMTIHHNTLFLKPHVIWKGIHNLISKSLLPNFEGFGFIVYPVSMSSCSPLVLTPECQSPVALYGRSHVELFLLPQHQHQSSPWQSLESNGLDLMHAMVFYCEVYRAIKASCRTIFDYLALDPRRTLPTPSPSEPPQLARFRTIFEDLPFMIFRQRMSVASWLASSSSFAFRYSTRSMVYTDGVFMNYLGVNPEDSHEQYHYREPSAQPNPSARVAFITAIYGGYESTIKPFVQQTIPSDFICFTDFIDTIPSNGWILDRTPYHELIPLPYDTPNKVNSFSRNSHPFNFCKFYKTAFHLIPRLQKYDLIIWIDGTVVITNSTVAETLLRLAESESGEASLAAIEHWRDGSLFKEADASNYSKYNSEFFSGYRQPIQDVMGQYNDYLELGYDENLWKRIQPTRPQYGLWITCFIGFYMKDPRVPRFLSMWHEHIMKYSTQDQVSFSFVAQFTGLYPYSFPDVNHGAEGVDQMTSWFYKHWHGE
jgi:hypothetical protein